MIDSIEERYDNWFVYFGQEIVKVGKVLEKSCRLEEKVIIISLFVTFNKNVYINSNSKALSETLRE